MSAEPYRVHVVVDPHYGERIRRLPLGEPAWVLDSTENYPVILAIWKERTLNQFSGITSFKFDAGAQPDDWLIAELWTIDIHHGEYSHDPPYSVLNVVGVEWSEKIQDELSKFGFFQHETTPEGFVARRDLNQERPACE